MLTPADMERVLESLDRRLTAIEQKLPTLATAGQVQALAVATGEQLTSMARATAERFEAMGRDTAERFEAMRRDTGERFDAMGRDTAERFHAMRLDTATQLEDVKQFARVLNEQTNDRIRLVAEGLEHLTRRVDDLPTRHEFRALSARVDDLSIAVAGIAGELSNVGQGVTMLTTRLEQRGVI